MNPVTVPASPRGYRSAAIIGIATIALGLAIASASVCLALCAGNLWWLALLLPALGLVITGAMICRARMEGARAVRPLHPPGVMRPRPQDFARHNRVRENVERWEKRYGRGGSRDEGSTDELQKRPRPWSPKPRR